MAEFLKILAAVGAVGALVLMLHGQLRADIRSLNDNMIQQGNSLRADVTQQINRLEDRLDKRIEALHNQP